MPPVRARTAFAALAFCLLVSGCGGTADGNGASASGDAAAAYEEGLAALNSRSSQAETEAAVAAFQRAVESDPDFAAAWSGLAQARMWLQWLYGVGGQLPEAEAAAARAAELDPGAKDTHLALGYIDYYGRGDLDGALGHFQAAEGIAADDAQVAGAIGNILRRQGRLDDAIVAYERRVEINPEHAQGLATLAGTYDAVGRHGDAWAIGDRLLELGDGRGYVRRFWASFHTADTARAWEQIPAIQEAQGRAGQPGYFAFLRAYARDDVGAADALIEEIGTEDTEAALAMLMAVHLGTTGQADAYANAFDAWITLNEDALVGGASTELDRTIQAVRHSDLALLEALRGNRDAAMAHIDAVEEIDLPSIDAWRSGPLIDVVLAQAALGETDSALAGLQDLVDRGSGLSSGWLTFEPSFDGFRDDPRFQALVDQRTAIEQPAM